MTLNNGSTEELRKIINCIREKYDIPFWQLERELKDMDCPVSTTTIYKFLVYGVEIPKKEKFLRKLAEKLKQRYPEELIEKPI